MRRYQLGAHTRSDLKVHLIWIPKYRKKVLIGPVAVRARDILRQIALEHELDIITGKVASDHVHMFISYRPNQDVSKIVQWLKGISSRVSCCKLRQYNRWDDSAIYSRARRGAGDWWQSIWNRPLLNPSTYSRGYFSFHYMRCQLVNLSLPNKVYRLPKKISHS